VRFALAAIGFERNYHSYVDGQHLAIARRRAGGQIGATSYPVFLTVSIQYKDMYD
jgi:hypothetical protein